MTAKFLYSLPSADNAGGRAMPEGLAVTPWYMTAPSNMFVAAGTFKFTPIAVVAEHDIDLDALASMLHADYPGIPVDVHANYVMATALAAARLKTGDRVRPIITSEEASIQVINTQTTVQLWTTPPVKGTLHELP